VQQAPSAGDGVAGRDRQQSQPEPFVFPPAGGLPGRGQDLHPGGQVPGEGDEGAPDLVLGEVVQRQVGRPGVFGGSDAVLGPGPAAVA
jgi:hypothetical protein